MITITISLEEYFELRLRGACSYIVLDRDRDRQALASLTAQPGHQDVCFLEEIPSQDASGEAFGSPSESREHPSGLGSPNGQTAPSASQSANLKSRNLVKLWPLKEYKQSSENLFRAKQASEQRVKAYNAFKQKSLIAKNKLISSGKLSSEKIEEIFSNLDSYPKVKEMIEKIVLTPE